MLKLEKNYGYFVVVVVVVVGCRFAKEPIGFMFYLKVIKDRGQILHQNCNLSELNYG